MTATTTIPLIDVSDQPDTVVLYTLHIRRDGITDVVRRIDRRVAVVRTFQTTHDALAVFDSVVAAAEDERRVATALASPRRH